MAINYNKLWKLLIDRGLIKKDLREMAGLSTNVIAKMLEDIVEIVPDPEFKSVE